MTRRTSGEPATRRSSGCGERLGGVHPVPGLRDLEFRNVLCSTNGIESQRPVPPCRPGLRAVPHRPDHDEVHVPGYPVPGPEGSGQTRWTERCGHRIIQCNSEVFPRQGGPDGRPVQGQKGPINRRCRLKRPGRWGGEGQRSPAGDLPGCRQRCRAVLGIRCCGGDTPGGRRAGVGCDLGQRGTYRITAQIDGGYSARSNWRTVA